MVFTMPTPTYSLPHAITHCMEFTKDDDTTYWQSVSESLARFMKEKYINELQWQMHSPLIYTLELQ